MECARQMQNLDLEAYCLKNLVSVFLKSKDYVSFESYWADLLAAEDSLEILQNRKQVADMEFVYELSQKDEQLEQIRQRMRWNRILMIALLVMAAALLFFLYRWIRKFVSRKEDLVREKEDLVKIKDANVQHLSREVEKREGTMTDLVIYLHEMKEIVNQVVSSLQQVGNSLSDEKERKSIKSLCLRLSEMLSSNSTVLNHVVDSKYGDFLDTLATRYPNLSMNERRICAMSLIGFSSKEMANVLDCTAGSLDNSRSRIRKKLEIPAEMSIPDFLMAHSEGLNY